MTARPPELPPGVSREEVRRLVERILDGVSGNATGAAPVSPGDPAPRPGAEASPSAPATASGAAPDAVTIAIGGDHGGYPLKERLAFKLKEQGYAVIDCGTHSPDPVDYPDIAHAVARKVADGEATWGIVVDGAGIGSAMAANKVPGIRAALCYDLSTARNSREHNHANVLTLGAGMIGDALAWQIVQEWLAVAWGPGRHARRVAKITDIERTYLKAP